MLIIFPNEMCVCGGGGGGVRRKRRMAGIGVEVGGCGVCSGPTIAGVLEGVYIERKRTSPKQPAS